MAKQATTKTTKTAVDELVKILDAYKHYVLDHGQEPPSVYKFTSDLKIKESVFYNHFNSFSAVKQHIWKGFITETITALHAEEAFVQYSAREKLLGFYFTMIEVLKDNRSYAIADLKHMKKGGVSPDFLKGFKAHYMKFVEEILLQAKETEEVIDRPIIGNKYSDGLWVQALFVLNFWTKDESIGFDKTDAAIEKAVNVSFDLMGKSPIDSMLDFAKFLYQNK
jgi:hypothetical protein